MGRGTVLFWGLLLACSASLSAQTMEEVKSRQEKTEKEIKYLNQLLKNTQNDQAATASRLSIIHEKIAVGQQHIHSIEAEIRLLELEISRNQDQMGRFKQEQQALLEVYGNMVYEAWKKKNRAGKTAWLFASETVGQAYARYKYFGQFQDYSKNQLKLLARNSDSLAVVQHQLEQLVLQKNESQQSLLSAQHEIIQEQNTANQLVNDLKKRKSELDKKLQAEIKNREKYKKDLQKLIDAQIKKSGSTTSNYKLTPEEKLVSDDFANNKGRLPWPVTEGFISEKFGINVSPLARQVKLNNDGVTITTRAQAEVRAVFDGVISEIIFIPGQNNVILLKHGNFFTLYNNLVEIYVKKGDKVKVKQMIGRLSADREGNSRINFQIWKDREILNPQLWLSK